MSHLWQKIFFYYLVLIAITYSLDSAEDALLLKSCDQDFKDTRSLIFVSTLDGKISALNASNYGEKQWTVDFNNGPILSSSIHLRELNNNGQWVRLIPSLSGQLYKFDGENLETMPITADQLLHFSLRFSDDLVFAGGKELHSYSIFANTGEIKYICISGVSECKNNTDSPEYVEQDILIIQRFQQTVRAIEDRTGSERWNFSVGQYELKLRSPKNISCSKEDVSLDVEIKAIIPEGLIWAVDKSNPNIKLWQYKFDSPIVTIWREDVSSRRLEKIDLFDPSQWVWGSEYSAIRPGLYLGMHDRQLYVQENHNDKSLLNSKYPWQPYPASITAITNTLPDKNNDENFIEVQNAIALSVLYNSEYINDNGFYLYSTEVTNKQCNRSSEILFITGVEKSVENYIEEENVIPPKVVSVWDWWKEILVISITTACLLNFMLTQRFFNNITVVTTKDAILPPLIVERHVEIKISDTTNDDSENFHSRFLMDYELVDCLGKGGYGVVFEVKNKIDDCNYAIKRIALSNSKDSRDRVMREVRALAKLEHHNIVRYYYAWLECPPSGWQEKHDQQWIDKLRCSTDFYSSEITQPETKTSTNHSKYTSQTDQPSVESAREASELNKENVNDDSFIEFKNFSNKKQYDSCINTYSTENSDLSLSSSIIEKKLPNVDETDNNIATEKKECKPQKPCSLDLKKKSRTQKSAKMFLYIQMQLCQRLSLREWLKQHTSVRDFSWILNIFQQIVDAVEYVHLQGLIHRDLKPSNIFFAYDDKIKIGDFGLVTAIEGYDRTPIPAAEYEHVSLKNNVHTACVGTHLYMSPEQMNGQIYNYKVDIYSLGIIFFELLIPFSTDMERAVTLSNLKKSIFPEDFAENYPAEYNLLKMMLDEDPAKRPTTLGIKAKPPLQNHAIVDFNTNKDSKWHFELP